MAKILALLGQKAEYANWFMNTMMSPLEITPLVTIG
jgi:hypothetical protein